jgi:uncharacterized protein (TIGR03435 family)
MKLKALCSVGLIFIAVSAASGQSTPAPAFEVASVKLIPKGGNVGASFEPGRLREDFTIASLLKFAFDFADYEVEGPAWAKAREQFNLVNDPETNRYVIDATFPPKSTKDEIRLMFQTLLADRFGLTYHREEREVKGYFLRVDSKGPKLTPSAGPPTGSYLANGTGVLGARDVTMAVLARRLAWAVSAPVVDATDIQGKFNVEIKYLADDAPTGTDRPSIYTALRETLGLRLDPGKPKISVFVIDHLNQAPTEN